MNLYEAKQVLKKYGYLVEGSMSLKDKIANATKFNSKEEDLRDYLAQTFDDSDWMEPIEVFDEIIEDLLNAIDVADKKTIKSIIENLIEEYDYGDDFTASDIKDVVNTILNM